MNYFKSIVAICVLVSFGVSFATVEAHSASFCDSLDVAQVSEVQGIALVAISSSTESHPSSDSHSRDSKDNCHCPNASNCSVIISNHDSVVSYLGTAICYLPVHAQILTITLDGLARPPAV